jgi:pantoate--beta-alanine ligase
MALKVADSLSALESLLATSKAASLGFVPTMGALHAGHAALVKRARAENEEIVVSIFVNPTQFNDPKDLEKYPRTREADLALLEKSGATIVWFPRYEELYADDYRYKIEETSFSRELCGRSRPGHFAGMLTVVMKLLQIVRPTRAYFGEKDYQQLELIKGMVKTFFLRTEIVPCPTERDAQGLALSSRNTRLSEKGIAVARAFAAALAKTDEPLDQARREIASLPLEIDYVEEHFGRRFAAVFVEGVRLIDNRPLQRKEKHS